LIDYKINPYGVHQSTYDITSQVVSLILKDETGKVVDVANLQTDISLRVPLKKSNNRTSPQVKDYSVPDVMMYRAVTIHREKTAIRISLTLDRDAPFEIYVKYGAEPTKQDYDYVTTLKEQPCKNKTQLCSVSHYVWFDAKHRGKYFIGLLQKHRKSNVRERRSASEIVSPTTDAPGNHAPGQRILRSLLQINDQDEQLCVKFKEPPTQQPVVQNKTLTLPPYDSQTSVNITLEVDSAGCLYWSEDKEQWMSEGCKVQASFSNHTGIFSLRGGGEPTTP